jgi:hypothetical protein
VHQECLQLQSQALRGARRLVVLVGGLGSFEGPLEREDHVAEHAAIGWRVIGRHRVERGAREAFPFALAAWPFKFASLRHHRSSSDSTADQTDS